MRAFLKKITSLTPIAAGAAVAMIVVGILAIVGGNYAHEVVHEQLAPQKIRFLKPAVYPDLEKYAGQQVLTGEQARLFANDQIAADLKAIAGGLTYSQLVYSARNPLAQTGASSTLVRQSTALFTGETLRGLLLNTWGWAKLGSTLIDAGIVLIIFGAILFLLPMLNWWLNLRGKPEKASSEASP
ncbi:MAG TPA: hypothetical protein VKA15_19430 [Isosphaeraceae bacterium]|nr:hypothetical protein [Isosphaeraceae bacterium]